MDMCKPLLSRLEAIKSEFSVLESQLANLRVEAKDIEAALRVFNRYSSEETDKTIILNEMQSSSAINLTDAIIEAVTHYGANGAASAEIQNYMKDKYGIEAKSTTLSVTIQRHRQKGRIVNRNNRWFLSSLAPQEGAVTKKTPVLEAQGNINNLF
ncbi:MAG: hypothetical protein AABY33_00210 [Pseudomonadota bacterium]